MSNSSHLTTIRHFYVDESGDGVLFDRKGRILLDNPNCPKHFILGLLEVNDPASLADGLNELRARMTIDPYFHGAPSMQPEAKKTAIAFHAKDDLPEIRRDVYNFLTICEMKFSAIVKNMRSVLSYVQQRNQADPAYRYNPDELYDHMARRLFRQRLHKDGEYRVIFARRGQANRTRALAENIEKARDEFRKKHGVQDISRLTVHSAYAYEQPCLQAVDYFLWAVQRLYEKGEDRYIRFIWPKASLIHDVDDTREKPYGCYYDIRKPLCRESSKKGFGYRNRALFARFTRHEAEFCPTASTIYYASNDLILSIHFVFSGRVGSRFSPAHWLRPKDFILNILSILGIPIQPNSPPIISEVH